jgi:hypothetical protein
MCSSIRPGVAPLRSVWTAHDGIAVQAQCRVLVVEREAHPAVSTGPCQVIGWLCLVWPEVLERPEEVEAKARRCSLESPDQLKSYLWSRSLPVMELRHLDRGPIRVAEMFERACDHLRKHDGLSIPHQFFACMRAWRTAGNACRETAEQQREYGGLAKVVAHVSMA